MGQPPLGTNRDHIPRIFHVLKRKFRVPFRIEAYRDVVKTPLTMGFSRLEKGAAGSWGRLRKHQ
jgi:hypothetical protein